MSRALQLKQVNGNRFFTEEKRHEYRQRIESVTLQSARQWGTMTVDQMLHHLNLACGGSLGFYDVPDESNFVTRSVGKWVTVDWLPEQPVGLRVPKGFKIPHAQRLSASGFNDAALAIAGLRRILAFQRAAFLRDGPPSLTQRGADLDALRSAMVARRHALENALNADFGHHSRHETAIMEVAGLVEGIKYLRRNLRAFIRPTRRHVALHMRLGKSSRRIPASWRRRRHVAMELPCDVVPDAGRHGHRRWEPGDAQTVRVHSGINAVLATMLSEIFREESLPKVIHWTTRPPKLLSASLSWVDRRVSSQTTH